MHSSEIVSLASSGMAVAVMIVLVRPDIAVRDLGILRLVFMDYM